MYQISKLNQISAQGLGRFPLDRYEIASDMAHPDAILVRSQVIKPEEISPSLKAIARAGAGVNNIPVDLCTAKGIVVFNTPGANANAVKELVLAALILSSRGVVDGMLFVNTLADKTPADIKTLMEKEKKKFVGHELAGKTLGVVGLGAIGSLVADMGLKLDMHVIGYDPELSVDAAWRISNKTEKMENLRSLLAKADYVTLHLPVLETTKNMINQENIKYIKPGARLINYSRGEIVETAAVIAALDQKILSRYATDFPAPGLIGRKDVLITPHIGASTEEAEDACAIMAVDQLMAFLEHGHIKNSVNFPAAQMERSGKYRLAIANRNIPGMLGKITSVFAEQKVNVSELLNKSRNDIAYNLIDVDSEPTPDILNVISRIEGVINVRSL